MAQAGSNGVSPSYDYDLFCIGAGSGGVRGSRFAASYGEATCYCCTVLGVLGISGCCCHAWAGAKTAICELPFGFKSSQSIGGVGGT